MRFIPGPPTIRRRRRTFAAAGVTVSLAAATIAIANAAPAGAAPGCRVDYAANSWQGGFTATLTITNLGDPLTA